MENKINNSDSGYITTITSNESKLQTIEAGSVELKIEEYLLRSTPRDTMLASTPPPQPLRTILAHFQHPKGIVNPEMQFGDSLGFNSRSSENVRKLFSEADGNLAMGSSEVGDQNQNLLDQYTKVVQENEILKKELEKQESELKALGPRYKYMEKHFEDFIRMKEEYLRLRDDKIKDGKISDTRNKAQQTWCSSIICDSCVKTLDIIQSPDFQHFVTCRRDDSYCVTKTELMELEEKFKILKETISERERDYENRYEKAEIIHLTALNCKYRSQLQEMHRKNKQSHNWANALQKVIAKIYAKDELGDLTAQEHGWVERIVEKYLTIDETPSENVVKASDSHLSQTNSDQTTSDDHQ